MRYFIRFSYDGSDFYGYQKQKNKRTVQGELERVLTILNGDKKVLVSASGRTDRGVHATNQCAHFDFDKKIKDLKKAMNSLLPNDIYIKEVQEVSSAFHARFDVIKKEYQYKINVGDYNPMDRKYIYQYNRKLDVSLMREAIVCFKGEHNFKSFAKSDDTKQDYTRTIYEVEVLEDEDMLTIRFVGSGFFRYMVRNMVGTLIEVGEGRKVPKDIVSILEMENRIYAGKTASPEGLYLVNVMYKEQNI